MGQARQRRSVTLFAILFATLAAVAVACGSDNPASGPTSTVRPVSTPVTGTATPPGNAATPTPTPHATNFQELLDSARRLWVLNGPASYELVQATVVFRSNYSAVKITVMNGEMTEAIDVDSGESVLGVDGRSKMTVPELFDWIQTALHDRDNQDVLDVGFDAASGFPTRISINEQISATDSIRFVSISDFTEIKDAGQAMIRERLEAAQDRWIANGPSSYTFDLTWSCFCAYGGNTTRLSVEDGKVVSAIDPATGNRRSESDSGPQWTLSQLFPHIVAALNRNRAKVLAASFDPDLGYPISASIDWLVGAIDDELSFTVTNFRPGSQAAALEQLQKDLDAARARWEALALSNYTFRFNWQCFCVQEFVAPVIVTVQNGVVTSVLREEDAQPVSEQIRNDFVTVDALFGRLQDAIAGNAASIRADFEPVSGLPTEVFIDYQAILADEELGWNASALTTVE